MKKLAHITTPSGMTLFLSGKPYKVDKASPLYEKILDLFDDQVGAETMELEIQKFLERDDIKQAGFENGEFRGQKMHPILVQKLDSIKDSGMPVDGLVEFFNRLSMNPSASSVSELYDFLSFKELPITEDGYFLAYKGVRNDYYSVMGNPKTLLAEGTKSDSGGHVYNGVGEKVFVSDRHQVDDDRTRTCSFGLHFGSLAYSKGWGDRVVVVKVDPKDVVSVPKDCQCQKARAVGYEVISDFKEEINVSIVKASKDGVKSVTANPEYENFCGRVARYVATRGGEGVKLSSIQNSFSPEYPSKQKVQSALQDLGYRFNDTEVLGD